MYREHPKGRKFRIQDIIVNVPPSGIVWDNTCDSWVKSEIIRRSSRKDEQYWERPTPPADYAIKRAKEMKMQESDPTHLDYELTEYRNQEWFRRLNGLWFMNNGEPEYITGLHYFYLTHWKIDIGYPDFRQTDKEFFYFLEYCIQDPNSLGLLEVTKRRQGKSARSAAFLYEYTSRTKNAHSGIQSKTLEDAKDNVYMKGVIQGFKYLPDFFVPVYDEEGGKLPKSGLRFYRTNKRGKSEDLIKEELESMITYKNSGKFAYDGTKMQRYVADEAGKCIDIDVWERHQVVQFCLMQEENIIGKALYTTTVEDMESGGEGFKKLWDKSNQKERNSNGRTRSGLYRYFMPAYRTMYFDKYGYGDEERAKEFFLAEREGLKDDPRALASYIRKNPFTIEEAFFTDSEKCHFDPLALNNQIESIVWEKEEKIFRRGEFVWRDGVKDSIVVFKETSNGKFLVITDLDVTNYNDFNRVQQVGSKKAPMDNVRFAMGVDPFDHNTVVNTNQQSEGAAYVYRKFSSVEDLSETFVVEYINRPATSEIFYEDMIKLAHFFGCSPLIEDQKIGLIKYFEARGYEKFLYRIKGSSKVGISASTKVHEEITANIETYSLENLKKVKFVRLLRDWLKFEIKNTTKYDATMASGYTLIAAGQTKYTTEKEEKTKLYDIGDIFPM